MRMTPPPNLQNKFDVEVPRSAASHDQKKKPIVKMSKESTSNLDGEGKSTSPSTSSSASSSVSSVSAAASGSRKRFGVRTTSQLKQEPSSSCCVNAKKRKLADAVPLGHEISKSKLNEVHNNWNGNNNSSSSSDSESVSTKLSLRDVTWQVNDSEPPYINSQTLLSGADRTVLDNIRAMKHYGPGEKEEEIRRGVSTELKLRTYQWNIIKKLKMSDVGQLSRLLLSTGLAEKHVMPFLSATDPNRAPDIVRGVRVSVWDADTNTAHSLVFKQWESSKSYVFNENWSQNFVKRRGLAIDDLIGMCWDSYHSEFHFSVLRRAAADH